MPQYTIRNVPESIDRELRERAKRRGKSLNETAIDAMKIGLGVIGEDMQHNDLDDLVGTWQHDAAFDQAIADQDQIEPTIWR